jgi:hypothetical protein
MLDLNHVDGWTKVRNLLINPVDHDNGPEAGCGLPRKGF